MYIIVKMLYFKIDEELRVVLQDGVENLVLLQNNQILKKS